MVNGEYDFNVEYCVILYLAGKSEPKEDIHMRHSRVLKWKSD